jgi:type II secretory pathway component GspD/PulD (secretin)
MQLPGTDLQAAVSLKQALYISEVLQNGDWGAFRVLLSAEDNPNARGTEAAAILKNLRHAFKAHEDDTSLEPALHQAKAQGWDWIERYSEAPSSSGTKKSSINTAIDVAWNTRVVTLGPESLEQLAQELEEVDAYGRRVELSWRIIDED